MKERFAVAILAAGQGTRLKSRRAKVLHSVGGRPLVEHTVRAALGLAARGIFVVVGHQGEAVVEAVEKLPAPSLRFLRQKEQLGTGHALRCGRKELESAAPHLLVLCADTPLVTVRTLRQFLTFHFRSGAAACVMTAEVEDPAGYGRILRGPEGTVASIVEHKSCSPKQLAIREINTGIYCFRSKALFAELEHVRPDPRSKEYYLTDVIGLLNQRGKKVLVYQAADPGEVVGINNRVELARVDAVLRERKARELMLSGVTILRPETVLLDPDVEVGTDTVIEPGVALLGATRVGKDCRLGAFSVIADSVLGDRVTIRPSSNIAESQIASGAAIGPFAHLRPGSEIGPEARIGNFVEVKKTRVGRGSKAQHLTYLGDATIGENVNVGAGTITVNYDGVKKHPTVVEDGAFIGSGSNLIAPVRVGRNAFVAAGSTITDEVPPDSLAIARGRQVNKPGWVSKRKRGG